MINHRQLTPEQQGASDSISLFLRTATPGSYFIVHGLAGTGKTELLAYLGRQFRSATLCAFTGKAASVLRTRTGLDTSTVHSAIYDFQGMVEDENDPLRKQPVFADKLDSGLKGRLVLLDECSTVGTRLANDLLATGAIVVASGDPGQLSPVMDTQFFNDPDIVLKEIHRQAWDSPIIRQAYNVRNNGVYESDGDGFRVVTRAIDDDLYSSNIALCWRNATRLRLNNRMREVRSLFEPTLQVGEPVMCLRNNHELKIYNGAIYTLVDTRKPGGDISICDDNGRVIDVMNPVIEIIDKNYIDSLYDDTFTPFALAYASTIHKFQGSEAENVLIIDECNSSKERRSLLYTGFTRASKRVTVVPWN